jgi:hypothetical protein
MYLLPDSQMATPLFVLLCHWTQMLAEGEHNQQLMFSCSLMPLLPVGQNKK